LNFNLCKSKHVLGSGAAVQSKEGQRIHHQVLNSMERKICNHRYYNATTVSMIICPTMTMKSLFLTY